MKAEGLVHRFDHLGGKVYHFRGRRPCYVSTLPSGRHRTRHGQLLLPEALVAGAEHVSAAERARANKILLGRAKSLPSQTPTLAGLDAHLRAVGVATIPNVTDAWDEVTAWCRIVELCETSERPFSLSVGPLLNDIFERVYRGAAA